MTSTRGLQPAEPISHPTHVHTPLASPKGSSARPPPPRHSARPDARAPGRRPGRPHHDERVVPLLGRGTLRILLGFGGRLLLLQLLLLLLLLAAAGARFLGPLLEGALVEAHGVPALQLQLLRLSLVVPVLAVDVVPPAALDALAEPLHHGAVLGDGHRAAAGTPGAAAGRGVSGTRNHRGSTTGRSIHPDAGPAEATVQATVDANTTAIRGGREIPHPVPRAHLFWKNFFFLIYPPSPPPRSLSASSLGPRIKIV